MNSNMVRRLLKHTDLLAAVAVVMIVTMLIVPLPSMLLDLLITLNISAALTIVVATMYLGKALDFASFPSLLLLTTMFRLAINVSVTRLILTTGDAGGVVKAFGQFVVGGNVVVGSVIFLILVVIQFVVVTNGAGRVAEVGARFTLDAMPGKQMAIDADLNAGLITDDQARAAALGDLARSRLLRRDGRRLEVRQRRRDGRRDHHRDQPRRRDHRRRRSSTTWLRRRDPPVLAADRRRRPRRADPGAADLGRHRHHRHARRLREGSRQRHRQPDPRPAQGAAGRRRRDRRFRADPRSAEAAVPGDRRRSSARSAGRCATACRAPRYPAQRSPPAKPPRRRRPTPSRSSASPSTRWSWRSASGWCRSSTAAPAAPLLRRVSMIRRQIAGELGHRDPRRAHPRRARHGVARVRAEGARLGGRARADHARSPAGDGPRRRRRRRCRASPRRSPRSGCPRCGCTSPARAEAEALGYTVVDAESVIVTHLTETIRAHAAELLTRQDVRALLDQLKETNAAVVEEVVPDMLSLGEIQRVLQSLLAEGVADPRPRHDRGGDRRQGANNTRHEPAVGVRPPGAGPGDHGPAPGRAAAPAGDHPGPCDRAGGRHLDHPDNRRRVPGDGAAPRAGDRQRAARPGRARHRTRRAPGAALLGARAPPPAQADRTSPTPPRRSAPTTRSRRASTSRPSE